MDKGDRLALRTIAFIFPFVLVLLFSVRGISSPAEPIVMHELIDAELADGRISADDAEMLHEWLEGIDVSAVKDFLDSHTELSSELIDQLRSWLDSFTPDSTSAVRQPARQESRAGTLRVRGTFRSRRDGNNDHEYLELKQQLDSTTSFQIDMVRSTHDSLVLRRRSLKFTQDSGFIRSVTLGSYNSRFGSGLLIGNSRPALRSDGKILDGFLLPSGRDFNGAVIHTEGGDFRFAVMGSYHARNDSGAWVAGGSVSHFFGTHFEMGIVGRRTGLTSKGSTNTSNSGLSFYFDASDRRTRFQLEIGGQDGEGSLESGLTGRFLWQTTGAVQLRHELSFWSYAPLWLDLQSSSPFVALQGRKPTSQFLASASDRAGQTGLRYVVRPIRTTGMRPELTVVFGSRSADTFAVMLEPGVHFPLRSNAELFVSGQLRSRNPSTQSALFLDEGEALRAEFKVQSASLTIRQRFGFEELNRGVSLTGAVSARVKSRTFEGNGEVLIRNLRKGARSTWRMLAEAKRMFDERAIYLRTLVLGSDSIDLRTRTSLTVEIGLVWSW